MFGQILKLSILSAMALVLVDAAHAAPARERARERDRSQTTPHIQGKVGSANAKGMREAYINSLYSKLQNRQLAEILQEVYLKPEKVENDPAAIKGVEKLVDLIRKNEQQGKNADEAVELALRELRPDLKLTSKDLIEACR